MRILVTGGVGSIGSRAVHLFLARGHEDVFMGITKGITN